METLNLTPFISTKENSATQRIGSDSQACEILRHCTPRKIVIRRLHAERDKTWKPDIIPGGYVGHCVNNREQRWFLFHQPANSEIVIRLNKRGEWRDKHGDRYVLGFAREFYDYNF